MCFWNRKKPSYSRHDYKNKEGANSRNGHSQKTLKTSFGNIEIETPRDRNGEFEPQLLKKNQTSITQEAEEKNPVNVRQRNDNRRYRNPYQGYIRS